MWTARVPAPAAPIRAWRDDLTLVLEALTYARAILSADVAILRHAGRGGGEDANSLVDDLPGVLGSAPEAEPPSRPTGGPRRSPSSAGTSSAGRTSCCSPTRRWPRWT